MKERHIIAAVCDGRSIGYKGDLIVRISADLKRFKSLTLGQIVIMGRKTYESLGNKPLPGRTNIVVTSKEFDNVLCVKSLREAYKLADNLDGERVFVIGGGQLYKEAIDYTHVMDITEIDFTPIAADVYFPEISDKSWIITDRSETCFSEKNPPYRFVTYERKIEIN